MMEETRAYVREKENMEDNFDLNKTNILLGKSSAILRFQMLFSTLKENGRFKNNELFVLPVESYHHSNYINHFKGYVTDFPHSFILVQNKEFLETIVNIPEDRYDVVSFDFNIVQVDKIEIEGKETLLFKTFSKQEAKELLDKGIDLRDFSFIKS